MADRWGNPPKVGDGPRPEGEGTHPDCKWPNCSCISRCYAARPVWRSESLPGREFDTLEELYAAMAETHSARGSDG